MLSIIPRLDETSELPLYRQLFLSIRDAILAGDIASHEKLPSLRGLAHQLNLSVTTIRQAYEQLAVEGYTQNRPRSGYFVNPIGLDGRPAEIARPASPPSPPAERKIPAVELYRDSSSFDFLKWRKCYHQVLTDWSDRLLDEGTPAGEPALRRQIARYIYQSRAVRCDWEQIIISAGTQQLINLLCLILRRRQIDLVSFEEPGYQPVRGIFRDRGFRSLLVPIDREGIQVDRLPSNIRSTAYVSPSNQFPTGSVMPVGRRYALLEWARQNNSLIIEDDYNSELRYDSRPVPSLSGLDESGSVVYIGSFSSTLFAAAKISYMVLPPKQLELFREILSEYDQTCSKTEQLALSLFMERGFFQANLRRIRKLYTQKRHLVGALLGQSAGDRLSILNQSSGLYMLLAYHPSAHEKSAVDVCRNGASVGLKLTPAYLRPEDTEPSAILFYYTRIPLEDLEIAVKKLMALL